MLCDKSGNRKQYTFLRRGIDPDGEKTESPPEVVATHMFGAGSSCFTTHRIGIALFQEGSLPTSPGWYRKTLWGGGSPG